MPKKKSFLGGGKIEKEFDSITKVYAHMIFSVFFIALGIYALTIYATNIQSTIFFLIIFAIGILSYYPLSKAGRDFINELYNKNKSDKGAILNVHLGFAWLMLFLTLIILIPFYSLLKAQPQTFDFSAFSDIATATIIADSIFGVLVSTQTGLGKRVLSVYQSLIMSIGCSIVVLMLIALRVPPSAIFVFVSLSIFSMYFLFGVFLFYTKLLLKYGPDDFRTQNYLIARLKIAPLLFERLISYRALALNFCLGGLNE